VGVTASESRNLRPVADRGVDAARDEVLMGRAIELARNGIGLASPNPLVGAVVTDRAGMVVGEGWHEGPGTAHAEVIALAHAGDRAVGGTLHVTLEPCNHHGRTPPCAPAIAEAGVARVVAAVADPNPNVAGGGFELLRSAGVFVTEGVERDQGARLIEAFTKAVTMGMPWVTLKFAMSLDGRVAASDGSSRWITGEAARADAHRLRAEHDAVMVGAGTAASDDPSLTVRTAGYRGRQPMRVVLDSTGRTSPRAAIFDGAAPVWMATTDAAPSSVVRAWERAGAVVLVAGDRGRVSLEGALAALATSHVPVRSVLIEGGPTLAWSAVRAGVVDRFVVYVAPKLIGGTGAPAALGGEGVASIGDARALRFESVERLGDDVRIVARPGEA
jgi:diaminohydroxyphosphoribosylaminopyrimidine deaminase / 5-amino-6-(5-phosphoribosylamino)uracil reductase